MPHPPTPALRTSLLAATALAASLGGAQAASSFTAVAAGDMTSSDAILWTSYNTGATAGASAPTLRAQVYADQGLTNLVGTYPALCTRVGGHGASH